MQVFELKRKVTADVVEALIGAFYMASSDLGAPAHFLRRCGILPDFDYTEPAQRGVDGHGNGFRPPSVGMARCCITLVADDQGCLGTPDCLMILYGRDLNRRTSPTSVISSNANLLFIVPMIFHTFFLKFWTRSGSQLPMWRFSITSTPSQMVRVCRMMEGLLGYTFKDRQVLLEACTHASWQDGSPSYQRLEFLGDAVLDLFVTKTLAEKYP